MRAHILGAGQSLLALLHEQRNELAAPASVRWSSATPAVTAPVQLTQFHRRRVANERFRPWIADVNPIRTPRTSRARPGGYRDDVDRRRSCGRVALPAWRATPGPARAELLYKWAAAIAARHEELAQLVTREVGKPIGEARGEVGRCVMILRYYAGEAVRGIGDVIPAQVAGALQFSSRQPLGVVALITPWNFPVAIPLWKAAPALAFGNTVVLKPSEMSSQSAALLAECAAAAGLPRAMFNVVLGAGDVVGAALDRRRAVRAVSFTGSGRVGATVAAAAAATEHPVSDGDGREERGDRDARRRSRQAASLAAAGAMRYAGQKCTATSRVVVARQVEDDFLAELRAQVAALPHRSGD